MRTVIGRGLPTAFSGLLVICLAACGGGGDTIVGGNLGASGGDPPAVIGDITPQIATYVPPAPAAVDPATQFSDSPLGLNPAYNMRPAEGSIATHQVAKASSALEPWEWFHINWITIAAIGEQPNPENPELVFYEGEAVSLWVEYEVAVETDHSRIWTLPAAGLDFTEKSVNLAQAGVYQVEFEINLPFGSATELTNFTLELGPPKSTSIQPPAGLTSTAFVPVTIEPTQLLEPVHYPPVGPYEAMPHAQMAWEDLITNSDYDYNDLVTSMHVIEYRNSNNELVQIELEVKALARGAGYGGDWQFNMESAFPGAHVTAIVDQYYDDGDGDHGNDQRHGAQRIWYSEDGTCVPVFAPTISALPKPPESYATNTVANTTFMEGDYAHVTIVLDTPMAQGTYVPAPYEPELRVQPHTGDIYVIDLWRQPGDPVDANGRPLGFIVPDVWPWPMEGKKVWDCYPGFNAWVAWINGQGNEPDVSWFQTDPALDYFQRSLFY